jgi:glycosyltransferase involved in cell wall biosynthesis
MKIAIDGRNLIGSRTGVGRYLQNLLPHLTQHGKHDFYIYSHHTVQDVIPDRPRCHYMKLPGPPLIWKQILLPIQQLKHRYDLFFIPTYSSPVLMQNWYQAARFRVIVPYTAKQAEYIIAVSEATRRDIIELTGVPNHKIEVVYLGVEDIFRKLPDQQREAFRERYQISFPFLLHVGSIHPRRNMQRLLEAFVYLKQEKKIAHHLVLVGLLLDQKSELNAFLSHPDIHYFGFVSDHDLVGFYNEAQVFIYPSLYEGFGLPVLEAMSCGTAVITSNVSSLPEVAGDAALLVDPFSREAIMQAILDLTSNDDLRRELIERGQERSRQFSWQKTGQQTLALMEHLMS